MMRDLRGYLFSTSAAVLLGMLAASSAGPAQAQDNACKPHAVDLGGSAIEIGCEQLRIAFLSAATNNVYLQAGIKGAQDAAAAHGAIVDVFDGGWDPLTQFNQAQNIITGGDHNAILAEMNDGNQSCKILTEDAPVAGVLVAVANQTLCGRSSNEGDELWSPGTLTFVGGSQGRAEFRRWVKGIAEANPGPQKVVIITGPDLNANTINTDLAIEDVKAAHPEFEIVGVVRTDYSVLQGNEKTLPLLLANPDLTILVSNYSDMTRGAVQGLQQAGMSDKVKVYDYGGNEWAFGAVKAGQIHSTNTVTPYTEMYKAIEALALAWKGEAVDRYIPLPTTMVTAENVDAIKPEY
ncbi:MAG: sugar ABC transporter substrate-binding protein [Devosia sp.]|uniref:sugar ABC transporter substrate-binding protein n=1 Tax=Devosia sp. TaxID=1871048 RepID=UPI001A5D1169|nr:sugar ABC transporter substrate-binding protein [Devosia sp.]MBL8600028.1 sugar ABC transporter substrate-binding protein [Devosia sp.]